MSNNTEELAPCQGCNGKVEIRKYTRGMYANEHTPRSYSYFIRCCGTEYVSHDAPDEAIKRWNTRPIEDQLKKDNEQLRALVEAEEEYIELLERACDGLEGIMAGRAGGVTSEGNYQSPHFEAGKQCRLKIEQIQAELDKIGGET